MNIRIILLIHHTLDHCDVSPPPDEETIAECLSVPEAPIKSDTLTVEGVPGEFVVVRRNWNFRPTKYGPEVTHRTLVGSIKKIDPRIDATITVVRR